MKASTISNSQNSTKNFLKKVLFVALFCFSFGQVSAQIQSSSYALDIFKSKGSMAIYVGKTMYVVTIKDNNPDNIATAAAKAAVKAGVTSEYKYEWFPEKDCVTLKDKYSRTFEVKCGYELHL